MSDANQPGPPMGPQNQPEAGAAPPPDLPPSLEPAPPAVAPPPPPRRRSRWKVLLVVLGVAGGLFFLLLFLVVSVVGRLPQLEGDTLTPSVYRPGSAEQVVAVLNVDGFIDDGKAALMNQFCRKIRKDSNVKVALLRVQSPGGGVSSCDRIYEMLKDLKAGYRDGKGRKQPGKKLVISMGSMAASGGYYISAPADAIYAEPTTLTGSIGVLGSVFVLKGTLDKIGVDVKLLPSTQAKAWKAVPNPFEEPAKYQMAELQKLIDAMHARFQEVVTSQRGKKIQAVTRTTEYTDAQGQPFSVTETEPYNGKVYLAEEARKIGLIDSVGYFKDAVDAAAKLANLDRPKVVIYRLRRGLLSELGRVRTPPLNVKLLDELQVPKLMMIWKVGG